jgi:hypothetical protein
VSSAPHPIAAIRTAIRLLLDVDDPNTLPAAIMVAGAMTAWLTSGGDLAEHMGLAPGWHGAMRQRERDKALQELARRYFPTLSGRPLARALAAAARGYEARQWPGDRAARRRPDGRDGLLHDVAAHGGMPGEARVRQIIAAT